MKKAQIKGLKQLASQLPASKEIQTFSMLKKGYECTMEEIEAAQIPIEAEKMYIHSGNVRIVDINHFNRLKNAYSRAKEKGLIDYIHWVDRNNQKMNKIYEKLDLQRVSNEIMDIANKGTSGFWSNLLNFLYAFLAIFNKKAA